MLLQDNPGWTAGQAIDSNIAAKDTKRVTLNRPDGRSIFYWTAFAGPDGVMNFRPTFTGGTASCCSGLPQGPAAKLDLTGSNGRACAWGSSNFC